MKIIPCLFFVCLFINQNAVAQNASARNQNRMHFGVKAGGGWSTFEYKKNKYTYNAELEWTYSFYGGFMANASFDKFFFQPELLYSLRGFRYRGYSQGTRFHYISMPLLIGFKPIKKLGILAGPELGYIISSRSHFTIDGTRNTTKFISYRNTVDVDAGLAWYITSKLSVEGRFVYGIKPLYSSGINSGGIEYNKDGYNKVFQFGVTYQLR